ncbi:hypothetical protein llap_11196 [Limosa lapponica baueri]|uniref:Uncharacterized protein n=1 Tax=Limosa lapponica baueri TaxID=1758121 RepID=A0A2I0TXG3_LIMLA|nr:hypothetical protein llap_11196 [Limosa lapponica baueri]
MGETLNLTVPKHHVSQQSSWPIYDLERGPNSGVEKGFTVCAMDRMMQEQQRDLYPPSPSSHDRCGCRNHLPDPEVILVKDWPKTSGLTKEKTTAGEVRVQALIVFQGQMMLISMVRKEPAKPDVGI